MPVQQTPGRDPTASVGEAKRLLRRRVLDARGDLVAEGPHRLAAAGQALAVLALDLTCLRSARRVACYVSVGSEPPTGPLLAALVASGRQVLVPVLLPDGDLDWAVYAGPVGLRAGRERPGLREPDGERLGPDAVAGVDVAIVPGLAVDAHGTRLGRGGGSYDRALARVPAAVTTVLLLHDGELLPGVPAEAHDRRVDIALTPTEVRHFGGPPG
jgi:5-formyltetrahydrofolate cyclo-ligase